MRRTAAQLRDINIANMLTPSPLHAHVCRYLRIMLGRTAAQTALVPSGLAWLKTSPWPSLYN